MVQTSEMVADQSTTAGWGESLREHQERLVRLVAFRLDVRLRGRVDPIDVVQDVLVEAWAHRDRFDEANGGSLFFWLRAIAINKLQELHRRHLGTQMRSLTRQQSFYGSGILNDTTSAMVEQLISSGTHPSVAAMREEAKMQLHKCLDQLNPMDREVLALKHFEHLTNSEIGVLLGIEERAAAKRHLRALARLRAVLTQMPGAAELLP